MDSEPRENLSSQRSASPRIIVKRLQEAASHTLIYGLGSVLQTALGFVLIPLYTRQFDTETYGTFALISLVGTIAGAMWSLGASSAMGRSYHDYDTAAGRRVVVGTTLWITLFGALVQMLLGVTLAGTLSRAVFGSSQFSPHIIVAFASSAFGSLNAVLFVLLRFMRRSVQVVWLNLFSLVVSTAAILYLLLVAELGILAPLLGTLFGRVVVLVPMAMIAREHTSLKWSRREVRLQLAFGIPNVVAGLLYYGLDSIDRFFINELSSLADVGVYSLGYKIAMVIQFFFVMPFSQIWAPMRVEYRHDETAPKLFSLVLTYFCMIGLLMTVCVSAFSYELVGLVAGRAEYLPAYRVVPVVMLAHLVYGTINIVDNGIIFERKPWYHIYNFSGALVINIGLNMLFIPRFGYMAAAYSTLLSYMLVAGMAAAISNRWYPVPWESGRMVNICFSGLLALFAASRFGVGIGPTLGKLAIIVALLVWWYRGVLSAQERTWIFVPRWRF